MSLIQVAAVLIGIVTGFALATRLESSLQIGQCGLKKPDASLAGMIDGQLSAISSEQTQGLATLKERIQELESQVAELERSAENQQRQLILPPDLNRALDLIYKTPQQRRLLVSEYEFGHLKDDVAPKCAGLKPP